MDLFQKFKVYIDEQQLFQPQHKLLLAVSGGMDSAVLCALCAQAELNFSIAHCNFKLRGEESDRDEHFVKELASKYGAPFYLKRFDTAAVSKKNKTSIEETARNLRYAWFDELMKNSEASKPYSYLLTAHHADDNIETVLMNFFRGTGIKGLRGILPKQNRIVRPLLFATRDEIKSYTEEYHIRFVTDTSNAENNYTRNYFRNELIPGIEKVFPKVKENLLENMKRFTGIEYLYNESITALKNKLIEIKGNEIHIPALKLSKTQPLHTVIHEIFKGYGFSAAQLPQLEKLLKAGSGKYMLSATHRVLKNRNWLIISPLAEAEQQSYYLIEKNTAAVQFPGGELRIDHLPNDGKINADADLAYIDAALLEYPLLLRRYRQGDYFYPLGMNRKKKLSRFFSDLKLSLLQKENSWVLESNKKIVWIPGYRLDDRFKVTAQTQDVVRPALRPTFRKGSDVSALQE